MNIIYNTVTLAIFKFSNYNVLLEVQLYVYKTNCKYYKINVMNLHEK